jgi:hypothetical protein
VNGDDAEELVSELGVSGTGSELDPVPWTVDYAA